MPTKIKVQAKDVNEAISKGLKELHLRKDQVDIKVLEQPRKGFLGIGSRPAVVEIMKKRWNNNDLDSQIYMDLPKRSGKRGGKNGRKGSRSIHRSTRSLEIRVPKERAPKENELQKLPSEAIQNAVIPEMLNAPMQEAKNYVNQVLNHMEINVENLNVWWDEQQQRILITLDCDQPAIVIGKEGKTLEAIQYLTTLAISRHFDKPISVIVDTQNYWRKAEDRINAEIEKGIEMIKAGSKVFRFRPMSAQLRRYIHHAVVGNNFVTSASEGEGKWRKVTLLPTQAAIDALTTNQAPADFVPGVIGEDIPEDNVVSEHECHCEDCSCDNNTEEHCSNSQSTNECCCCEKHEDDTAVVTTTEENPVIEDKSVSEQHCTCCSCEQNSSSDNN